VRILIYTHAIAPKIGGVETYVMLLAQGLAQRLQQAADAPLQVTVVTPTPAGSMDDSVLPFRMIRQPGLVKLVRLLRQADVIHLAGPCFLPMLFGSLFRKAVVLEHDGYQAICPNGLLVQERSKAVCPGHFMAKRYFECIRCNSVNVGFWKSLRMLLLTFARRRLCHRVTRNVAPSAHIGKRVALPRTITIYHGVPELLPAAQPIDKDRAEPLCFAYVGRLVSEKGVPILLGAAGKLASRGYDFRLKIIGDGPERTKLKEITDHYGLRDQTLFLGSLQGETLQQALKGVCAAIMPSIWEDVAPLTAIEHMIQGRLLIASDIGGLGELVDGVGLKFQPGDTDGLTWCLQRVLDEPHLPAVLGERSRRRALELFSEKRMVKDHLSLYSDLIAAHVPNTVSAPSS
jgi:glycosyltransferase involved in cell wall biosynthesis